LALTLTIAFIILVFQDKEEYQTVPEPMPVHYNGEQFAGSASCIPCHQDIYQNHLKTAHFNTSAIADGETLHGHFNQSSNKVELLDGTVHTYFDENGYFQAIKSKTNGEVLDVSRIDMVIGSGVKGQSHLNFSGDSLFQLQASYFTLSDSWINSPGFPNHKYKRPVNDNCIKCHTTFAQNKDRKGNSNLYESKSFMYGIDCERCHGPLKKHVAYRNGILGELKSDVVIKIDTLSRQLKMDVCVQCHSGLRAIQIKDNPFSFVVGEQLDTYTRNYRFGRPESKLDVHGNQYGLLKSSQCFKNSEAMSCTTCHDPHKNQRGKTEHFNSKCIECHASPKNLHNTENLISQNLDNCISCHMPLFPSQTMKVKLDADSAETSVKIRTHLIGVYVDGILQNAKTNP
jgi:hypothetical protein